VTRIADWGLRALLGVAMFAPLRPALAQRVDRELGVQVYSALADGEEFGVQLYGAVRPTRRGRVSLSVGAGSGEGSLRYRVEGLGHVLLSPRRTRGAGLYAAGGLGLAGRGEYELRLIGVVGLEGRPGARRGWVVEGGFGGGWRVSAGLRWRR
jgi:hypothetical protein